MLEKEFYRSKKFWVMIVAVLMNLVEWLGVEGLREVSYPLFAYLIGQGIADIGKTKPPV